jgi:hypothetical protein
MKGSRAYVAIAVLVGAGLILVGILRLLDPLTYGPDDWRSQPWFYPVTSGILVALGLLGLVAGWRRWRQG